MSYCEICDEKYKKPGYATSERHINTKLHQDNLKRRKLVSESKNPLNELILFNLLQNQNSINYSSILKFFSSFGIKAEITLKTLIKKLKDEDIDYQGDIDGNYEKILNKILEIPIVHYPLTLSVQEAFTKFNFLGLKYPTEMMEYLEKLSMKFPSFLSLSSSKLGEPSDLITFKKIFIDELKFFKKNNWDIK
ncbi:MAG: hypothetical protein GF353_20555 [Candidatus Lokiarchaeota archaeon]|nr:hypothetical protein [Candidatus Lokiarchaeota archaeon]